MAATPRRVLLLAFFVGIAFFIGQIPGATTLVHAADDEQFETPRPPRLYAGDYSHPGVAEATESVVAPIVPLNGYCIRVHSPNHMGVTDFEHVRGFKVVPGAVITPAPAAPPTDPQILSTDYESKGTATTADDVYCVVVRAPTGRVNFTIEWAYTDAACPGGVCTKSLVIPVVTVTLRGTDGVVGGAAQVCTIGWDRSFLTGRTSNIPGTLPDPLDDVRAGDWSTIPALTPGVLGNPYHDPTNPVEWCVNIGSNVAVNDIDVTFQFDSVYDTAKNADDEGPHTVSLPAGKHIKIVDTPYSELRHVSAAGQLLPDQVSPPLVAFAREYACIVPSDALDPLPAPGDVVISNVNGDQATVSGLVIYHDGPGQFRDFAGVADGTVCISWSSTSPGEQAVHVTFCKNDPPAIPPRPFCDPPYQTMERRFVGWRSEHAAVLDPAPPNAVLIPAASYLPLIVQWNRIDSTRITTSSDPNTNVVTYGTVIVPVQFNVATGSYLFAADVTLTEWVFGSHNGQQGHFAGLLDGVVIRATIAGQCGHFVTGQTALGATVTGTSVGGRFELDDSFEGTPNADVDDLQISITNDLGCNQLTSIRVNVDVFYPGTAAPAIPTEYVDIQFEFQPFQSAPIVAWAGQTVVITYAFATNGTCGVADGVVDFLRGDKQSGTFFADPGIVFHGAGHASTVFGSDCSASVRYESEDPGEVDVEVTLNNNRFSKVVFTIFFIAIEDVSITATDETVVSTPGNVSATVTGWFVGNNPSGATARKTPDGRTLPANRWVLPTDWGRLIGNPDARPAWPGSPDMPPMNVTFFMQNEAVVNSYPAKVTGGDAGWFLADTFTEFAYNLNPRTLTASTQGTDRRPRILSDKTDFSGQTSVATFGDFNLTFEGCPPNAPTGNPQCRVDDIVGHSHYFAVAWYGPLPGKWPAVASNVVQTTWKWDGFKQVTVLPGGTVTTKYVVVHLRDRDGYCDASGLNNALGVPVLFELYGNDGRITQTGGSFSVVNASGTTAVVTTFDTLDDFGMATHQDMTLEKLADDECQAWIRVSSSLNTPLNVRVEIPGPPAALPGKVRIVGLQCTAPESVTLQNVGSAPVSLAGFALRSGASSQNTAEEHLQLDGVLQPGEVRVFNNTGWVNGSGEIFRDPPATPVDYARLVWNEIEISRAQCDGQTFFPPFPTAFAPDPEGDIVIDVPLVFGGGQVVQLQEGWNLITVGASVSIDTLLAGNEANVAAIYTWDAQSSEWARYVSQAPVRINNLVVLTAGQAYWVQVKRPFTLTIPG